MAKSARPDKDEKKVKYPSQYGSHASMVDENATEALGDSKLVCLIDENGPYTTERWRLDCGEADPNRNRQSRQKFD